MRECLGLPPAMFDILTDVAVDDPTFIHRYIVPTLCCPGAYERVLSDLSDAAMALELAEAGLGEYDGLGNLGKSFLKKVGQALKKVALAPVQIREKVAHVIVDAVKGKSKSSAPAPVAAPAAAVPPPPPAAARAPLPPPPPAAPAPIAYSGPSTFAPPSSSSSSSGGGSSSSQASDYQAPPPPAPAAPGKASGIQQASMFDGGGSLPLLAVGAVLALIFGKKDKASRRRRNPAGRGRRAVA